MTLLAHIPSISLILGCVLGIMLGALIANNLQRFSVDTWLHYALYTITIITLSTT